jgi:hypothetical protein
MRLNQRIIACFLLCSVAATTVGCTSMRTIHPLTDPATSRFGGVKGGDTVVVEMRDGRRARFVVQQTDADAIVSKDGVRYGHSEIARLQRRSFSGWKTAFLVGGVFTGAFMVLAIMAVSELSENLY